MFVSHSSDKRTIAASSAWLNMCKNLIFCIILLSLTQSIITQTESDEIEDLCEQYEDCTTCIQGQQWCAWCADPFLTNQTNCFEFDPEEDLDVCEPAFLYYPFTKLYTISNINVSKIRAEDKSFSKILIQPQEIKMEVRLRK